MRRPIQYVLLAIPVGLAVTVFSGQWSPAEEKSGSHQTLWERSLGMCELYSEDVLPNMVDFRELGWSLPKLIEYLEDSSEDRQHIDRQIEIARMVYELPVDRYMFDRGLGDKIYQDCRDNRAKYMGPELATSAPD